MPVYTIGLEGLGRKWQTSNFFSQGLSSVQLLLWSRTRCEQRIAAVMLSFEAVRIGRHGKPIHCASQGSSTEKKVLCFLRGEMCHKSQKCHLNQCFFLTFWFLFSCSASCQQDLKESSSSDDENDNMLSSHKVWNDRHGVPKEGSAGRHYIHCFCVFVRYLTCSAFLVLASARETEEEAGEDVGPAG